MITHESDLWPDRRWGVERDDAGMKVAWFRSEEGRDRWVAQRPHHRRAVGKRHPAVKALRQQWRAAALVNALVRRGPAL